MASSRNSERVVQLESEHRTLRGELERVRVRIADVSQRLGAVGAHCDASSYVAPTRRAQKDGKRDGSARSKSGQAGADAAEGRSRLKERAKGPAARDTGACKGRNENRLVNGDESKRCDECGFVSPRSRFSKKQWNRTAGICEFARSIRHPCDCTRLFVVGSGCVNSITPSHSVASSICTALPESQTLPLPCMCPTLISIAGR